MIHPTVQVHVHNISFDCIKRQELISRTIGGAGYKVKECTYLTDGNGAYTEFDPDNIISRGSFFILRMKLQSDLGLPPLEARCGFQRSGEGRGHARLWLESTKEARPAVQASHFVKIEGFSGDLMSASLRVEQFVFTIMMRCRRSWDEPGTHIDSDSDRRVHLHIHIASQQISSIQPDSDRTELCRGSWHDFFPVFKRTELYVAEIEKLRLQEEKLREEQRSPSYYDPPLTLQDGRPFDHSRHDGGAYTYESPVPPVSTPYPGSNLFPAYTSYPEGYVPPPMPPYPEPEYNGDYAYAPYSEYDPGVDGSKYYSEPYGYA
jgi:hypothetical protein